MVASSYKYQKIISECKIYVLLISVNLSLCDSYIHTSVHTIFSKSLPNYKKFKCTLKHDLDLPSGSAVKNPPAVARDGFDAWVRKIPLEKEMVTHSSILVWETAWTEEPGGLQAMESQRVRHNWKTKQQQTHDQRQLSSGSRNSLLLHLGAI